MLESTAMVPWSWNSSPIEITKQHIKMFPLWFQVIIRSGYETNTNVVKMILFLHLFLVHL